MGVEWPQGAEAASFGGGFGALPDMSFEGPEAGGAGIIPQDFGTMTTGREINLNLSMPQINVNIDGAQQPQTTASAVKETLQSSLKPWILEIVKRALAEVETENVRLSYD